MYIYPPTLAASSVLEILCHPASTRHQSKAARQQGSYSMAARQQGSKEAGRQSRQGKQGSKRSQPASSSHRQARQQGGKA